MAYKHRRLMVDADKNRICYVDDKARPVYYSGVWQPNWADYIRNPFNPNEDRGDWGKCLPEQAFGKITYLLSPPPLLSCCRIIE